MHFETRFQVAGTPETVVEQFSDVPLMASFLPGASVDAQGVDGSYPATLIAAFGPKKIVFKGTLTNRVDPESLRGTLSGKASADVRGARMAVTMNYQLVSTETSTTHIAGGEAAPARTEVRLESDAQLTGVLAEFAKAGGVFVAEALIAEFARRFSAYVDATAAGRSPAPPARNATLSMTTVAVAMLRRFRRAFLSMFSRAA